MPDRADFAAAVRALAAEERARAGAHPEAEEIAAYAAGALEPSRAEALAGHLAVCAECAELVLEYGEFAPAPAADAAREGEVAAAYGAVRRELGLPPEGRAVLPGHGRFPRAAIPWLLAAAAALAAIGLGWWGWSAHRALEAARAPRVNVAVVDLEPRGSDQVRGEGRPAALDLASGADLLLLLPGMTGEPELRVVILDARGRELWRLPGARYDPLLGNLSLSLPPASLAPGRYEIRVHASRSGDLLATYPIEIR